jgi:nucleotide-binding universal stress UspA family protein
MIFKPTFCCGRVRPPRLRKLILGGVTHHILKHITLPVPMSH